MKARSTKKSELPPASRLPKNPLAVVPVVPPGVEARLDEQSFTQLKCAMQPRSRIYAWISRKMRYRHDVRINLDGPGSTFWSLIDGRRNLQQIAEALAEKHGWEQQKSREASIKFTATLMQRHLLHLIVPE